LHTCATSTILSKIFAIPYRKAFQAIDLIYYLTAKQTKETVDRVENIKGIDSVASDNPPCMSSN